MSFLKLFQNKTLGWLATASCLQSSPSIWHHEAEESDCPSRVCLDGPVTEATALASFGDWATWLWQAIQHFRFEPIDFIADAGVLRY